MSLSSYTHDFGIISSDIICRDSITITNVGNARLEIGEIETGCGCTQASVEKYELNPDESCSLHFSFNPKGKGLGAKEELNYYQCKYRLPLFIFCKLRQLFSDNVFTFSFLLITTLYLSADWFMDRYFMPKNISFVVGIILWGRYLHRELEAKKLDCLLIFYFCLLLFLWDMFSFAVSLHHNIYTVYTLYLDGFFFVLMRNRKKSYRNI